jgi:NAD/NADP transhydrogenase beta subunit
MQDELEVQRYVAIVGVVVMSLVVGLTIVCGLGADGVVVWLWNSGNSFCPLDFSLELSRTLLSALCSLLSALSSLLSPLYSYSLLSRTLDLD